MIRILNRTTHIVWKSKTPVSLARSLACFASYILAYCLLIWCRCVLYFVAFISSLLQCITIIFFNSMVVEREREKQKIEKNIKWLRLCCAFFFLILFRLLMWSTLKFSSLDSLHWLLIPLLPGQISWLNAFFISLFLRRFLFKTFSEHKNLFAKRFGFGFSKFSFFKIFSSILPSWRKVISII